MLATEDVQFEQETTWGKADFPASPASGPAWYATAKVGVDFALASLMLILAAPVMLVAALVVKWTSPGPVFYSQTRLGRNGRPYTIYKIRTMTHNCERLSGPQWSTAGDARITPVGRWLRKTHIDELPQLWNVLKGDMSLVGPRPERPEFAVQLERAIPTYMGRLSVRPGVTGLAQIQLPPDTDINSVRRKLKYDLYYVRYVGFWLDMRILCGTVFHVLGLPVAAMRIVFRVPGAERVEFTTTEVMPELEPTPGLQSA